MKASLGLVLLSAVLLAPRVKAGPVNHFRESFEGHCDYRTQYTQPCVPISLPPESASISKNAFDLSADNYGSGMDSLHSDWIAANGTTTCWGDGGPHAPIQILPASTLPVNPTPEPAPLLLFGTVILGALVLTKVRS
jgi:hypothetical protein